MIADDPRDHVALPASVEELVEIVRAEPRIRIEGLGRHAGFLLPVADDATPLSVRGLDRVVEHHAADQVVVVQAGATLAELNEALAPAGQCIPFGRRVTTGDSTVGGLISMNLPHALEAQCGSWRDWILRLTVVLADGSVAKGGSLAVKNVAGYDVQKLFIGARGTLGVIVEVVLRTYPVRALPNPDLIVGEFGAVSNPHPGPFPSKGEGERSDPLWVQRVMRSDFAAASQTDRLMWADRASSTIVCQVDPPETLPRFPHDWVVRSGCGPDNLTFTDQTHIRLMRRAKDLLDPTGKLNRGALGVI